MEKHTPGAITYRQLRDALNAISDEHIDQFVKITNGIDEVFNAEQIELLNGHLIMLRSKYENDDTEAWLEHIFQ